MINVLIIIGCVTVVYLGLRDKIVSKESKLREYERLDGK